MTKIPKKNSKAVIAFAILFVVIITISVFSTVTSTSELSNAVIIYGLESLNGDEITFVASHFNMLICELYMSQSTLQSLKSLNPNIQIFGYCDILAMLPSYSYWLTVNANENNFLHDIAGNRITEGSYGWYLMDISSTAWRTSYSSYVNSKLSGSYFDGLFSDDGWEKLWTVSLYDAVTHASLDVSGISSTIISNWHSNMIGMLQYIEANITPGKKVILNTDYVTNDYLNVIEGKMAEGYPIDDRTDVITQINAMTRDSATGKIFVSCNEPIIPYNPNSTILAEVTQNVNFCYAATLLGMTGANCYFSYGSWSSKDGSEGYYPIMNTTIGSPCGSYYFSQGVYMRNYTNGTVLLNASDNSYKISLGRNYYLTNGTQVSSITLIPWSGETLTS